MLCRDLYLPFTAVLTVAGLSQRKDHFEFTNFAPRTPNLGHFLKIEIRDLTQSYKDRISYSIIRDKRSRRIYKFYKKWSNLEGWKQLFFSTPPERLPVRCKFHTQA